MVPVLASQSKDERATLDKSAESEHEAFRVKGFQWNGYDSLDLREMMCRYAWTTGVGIMRRCHEIVMDWREGMQSRCFNSDQSSNQGRLRY
jgi:hypothetical protein